MVVRRLLRVVNRRSIPAPRLAEHLRLGDSLRRADYLRPADWRCCHRRAGFRAGYPVDCPASANFPSQADWIQLGPRRRSVFERSKYLAETSTAYGKHSCEIPHP
jgi:hypothetical protein